ncbi:MAG: crossover junction endodeoxyribonuclease RuvC [Holophagales bacterium]|nr:crossover junction endodeoxyribonuclease RuvC [Holophagales bacterium]
MVERRGSRLRPVAHGRIRLPKESSLTDRLAQLSREIEALVSEHRPQVAVLESLYHGVNPRSLIVLAQARGALLATLARAGLKVEEYSPAEIKSAVTGHGRADKQQVARMVSLILGLREREMHPDASDALAVAICFAQRFRLDSLGAPGTPKGSR